MADTPDKTPYIAPGLLSEAIKQNIVRAYSAKDVLDNMKQQPDGTLTGAPVGMRYVETRTDAGVTGAFIESVPTEDK